MQSISLKQCTLLREGEALTERVVAYAIDLLVYGDVHILKWDNNSPINKSKMK